jgi:hypothetical protein
MQMSRRMHPFNVPLLSRTFKTLLHQEMQVPGTRMQMLNAVK